MQIYTHPEYDKALPELVKVRDCIKGSPAVKAKKYTYLPHPSQVDQESEIQQMRYRDYLAGAEFENDPLRTRRTLVGKMRVDDADIVLPDRLGYLAQNTDGDGTGLTTAIEHSISEALEMKFHLLVADYKGLSDAGLTAVSIADLEAAKLRATVKQYSREAITNWAFRRVNGVMQLAYLQLLEVGYEFDPATGKHECLKSYLVLALDQKGHYYQQKIIESDAGVEQGPMSHVSVGGKPMTWIPAQFVCDTAMPIGRLPMEYGFIHPICDIALHRYRVSAVYKETQRALVPTRWTKGWSEGDFELFKTINGRDYQVTGGYGCNNYPNDVDVGVLSVEANMDDFHWYFDEAGKKIERLGGDKPQGLSNMTATEAEILANEQNALLEALASNAEQAWKRVISYCAMFEGIWAPDAVETSLDQITLSLPRNFAQPRLSVDEVRVLMEMRMNRDISQDEFHRQIKAGGWLIADVELLLEELENEGPSLGLPREPEPEPEPSEDPEEQ